MDKSVDILIIGGGIVGFSLAQILKKSGIPFLLIEKKANIDFDSSQLDRRNLALSSASVAILKTLQIWSQLAPHLTPIDSIHVSTQKRFGSTLLERPTTHPLGYTVPMSVLHETLSNGIDADCWWDDVNVEAVSENGQLVAIKRAGQTLMINTKLLVAADGAMSKVRGLLGLEASIKDYCQTAIIANVEITHAHHHRAYERFTPLGPLALLPLQAQQMALILTLPSTHAYFANPWTDKELIQHIEKNMGYRVTGIKVVGARDMFPLKLIKMSNTVLKHTVFVGNAAQSLHPIAGQGFNLGLRDVATLFDCLEDAGINTDALSLYQQRRTIDVERITSFTDKLVSMFASAKPGIGLASGLGMLMLDNSAKLQTQLAKMASGYSGYVPRMALMA